MRKTVAALEFAGGDNLDEARRLLAVALVDVAETALECGLGWPTPNRLLSDAEMDLLRWRLVTW